MNIKKIKITISLLLSILFLVTVILCYEGSKKNEITISFKEDYGYITNLNIGSSNYPLKQFTKNKGMSLEHKKLRLEKDTKFELKYSKILNIDFLLETNNKNTAILIVNGKKDNIKLNNKKYGYLSTVSIRSILSSFLKHLSIKRLVLLLITFITYFILSFLSIDYIEKFYNLINKGTLKLLDIFKFLVVLTFLYLSTFYIGLQFFKMMILIPIIVVISAFIFLLRSKMKDKIAEIFVFLVLVLGITMVFVLPAFHVPDEASHYIKSYSIFNKDSVKKSASCYIFFPKNISDIFGKYNMDIHNSQYHITAKEFFADSTEKLDFKDKDSISLKYGSTMNLPMLCYLPAAIITGVCLKIGVPFIITFLLSRIINLFIFAVLGYYSIKITPKFKSLFLLIMLLPITIQQAIGINQDCITNSLFILAFAIILNLIYSKKGKNDNYKIISLITLSILLGFCKIGYFSILFLALLIPSDKFKNKKIEYLLKTLIILPCLTLSILQYLTVASATSKIALYYPISAIYKEPIQIIKICVNTVLSRGQLDFFTGLIDGFGWSTVWHTPFIQYIVTILGFLLIITATDKNDKINLKNRIGFLIIFVIMVGFIYASLLFGWTKVGENMIGGLQSRYFIPAVFLFYIGISNEYIILNFKNKHIIRLFGIIVINILSLCTIISSYYL